MKTYQITSEINWVVIIFDLLFLVLTIQNMYRLISKWKRNWKKNTHILKVKKVLKGKNCISRALNYDIKQGDPIQIVKNACIRIFEFFKKFKVTTYDSI